MLCASTPVSDRQVVIGNRDATAIPQTIKVVFTLVSHTSYLIEDPLPIDFRPVLIFVFQWKAARQLFFHIGNSLQKRVPPLVLPAFQLLVEALPERCVLVTEQFVIVC